MVVSGASSGELMSSEPDIFIVRVSSIVSPEAAAERASPGDRPEAGPSGAIGPSRKAWIGHQSRTVVEEIRHAVSRLESLSKKIEAFDSGKRGLIDAYVSLKESEALYYAAISSVSAPNRLHRYPEQTFIAVRQLISDAPDLAWMTGHELRRRHSAVVKRVQQLEHRYPNLSTEVSKATRPSYFGDEIPVAEPFIALERQNAPSALEHELLMRLANCDEPLIRYIGLTNLGRATTGKHHVARFLYSIAFGSGTGGRDDQFPSMDRIGSLRALGDLGSAADFAVDDISKLLTTRPHLISQVEEPVRALRGIGTPRALESLDRFERENFDATGKSTSVPRGVAGWKGFFSKIAQEEIVLVRDGAEWQRLWERHSPGGKAPSVDFKEEMVVGIFLGATHLEFLRLGEVLVTSDRAEITYEVLYPDFVAEDNYEFLLARIGKSLGEVTVRQRHRVAMAVKPGTHETVKKVFPRL